MANKQVAELKPTAVAVVEDDLAADFATPTVHNLPREAFTTPFLKLLQPLSPECHKKMDGYVEGAKPGMFYNTTTRHLYEGTLTFIPAYTEIKWIEWVPKDQGGGMVAQYDAGHPRILEAKNKDGKQVLPNGNILEETHHHYGVIDDNGTHDVVVISMKGTQRKESRRLNTLVHTATIIRNGTKYDAKPWHYAYTLGMTEASNDKGSWFKWEVRGRDEATKEQRDAGREFARSLAGGARRADVSQDVEDESSPQFRAPTRPTAAVVNSGVEIGDLDDNDLPMA